MARQKILSVSIADCRVECIASTGGAGGQNKNRRHTAVRITHPPSGAVGFSADERDQLRNKQVAWGRLARSKDFQNWQRVRIAEILSEETVDQKVDKDMNPRNIRVEVKDEHGRWKVASDDDYRKLNQECSS